VSIAQDKLAKDAVILDMRPVCSYTDYFVIVSGQNPRQTKAIFDEVHEQMKRERRLIPQSVEGGAEPNWIVVDYLDVVLHVMTPEAREYYALEDLWGDVPSVELETATA
jgi:ribosome-associated protein